MKKAILILSLSLLFMACTKNKETIQNALKKIDLNGDGVISSKNANPFSDELTGNQQFWNKLISHCGKSFEGKIISEIIPTDFKDQQLIMHLLHCDEKQVLIPFNVGENKSRTWIFNLDENIITLKHDHRKENGTEDEVTMYGGSTSNTGFATMAVFPADQETLDRIPYAGSNIWWVTLSDTEFTYNLKRIGGKGEINVSFDLTNPIEKPEASWGWENFESKI